MRQVVLSVQVVHQQRSSWSSWSWASCGEPITLCQVVSGDGKLRPLLFPAARMVFVLPRRFSRGLCSYGCVGVASLSYWGHVMMFFSLLERRIITSLVSLAPVQTHWSPCQRSLRQAVSAGVLMEARFLELTSANANANLPLKTAHSATAHVP